jgi:hypothetical protein
MRQNSLDWLTKIAIQFHLVAKNCTICSSRSRRPVRKLLVTLSCVQTYTQNFIEHMYVMWCALGHWDTLLYATTLKTLGNSGVIPRYCWSKLVPVVADEYEAPRILNRNTGRLKVLSSTLRGERAGSHWIGGDSSPGKGWEFLSSPPSPNRPWRPPSPLSNRYQGLFPWG